MPKEALVARLRAAVGIIIGKTNTPEFGSGTETNNLVFGPTLNPFDLERTQEDHPWRSGGFSNKYASAMSRGDTGGSLGTRLPGVGLLGFAQHGSSSSRKSSP